ncbi:hypothetical protein FOCG_16210 [Fusarium oxysporum f. sp. radicis-lycopersici 26381]|uniref:Uncharacterized protein n=1 Tax=Fusarium oxysporum Fo47 TaxID=660027 RepID=W9J9W3_FUSOX|nr:hypothetical protein FOZG_17552 [Fusarium oxysporum Fo47]EXL41403.1 hypothetical protein FOCG_16210 [Fusarium oxysporum f. sp. radicis-lycopersici 26381]
MSASSVMLQFVALRIMRTSVMVWFSGQKKYFEFTAF